MNVCEALLDILAEYDVKYILGIPGDATNDLPEAIRKQNKIIYFLHEESVAFAASAQLKLSERLWVCTGISGQGAINDLKSSSRLPLQI
jgi:pyruvate oxidase